MRFANYAFTCALLAAMSAPVHAQPVEAANGGNAGSESGDKSAEVTGTIDAVTVYRGQALVTRLVDLAGPAGLQEVVVTGLPEQMLPGSIYAESADGVEVRSVRYRVRPVSEDVRAEVREIEEQIEQTQAEVAANQRYVQLAAEHKAYLEKLQQFVAPTAQVELTKGVLDAETLQTLTEFIHTQRKSLAEEELNLAQEQQELQEQLNLLQRRRETVAGGSAKTIREAVVFVNLANAQGGQLRVRYLVNNASWSPSYNLRTDAERAQVLVEYNASIQQMTGEDWNDVAMTLSTATPSMVATAPELAALSVTLTPPTPEMQQAEADMSKAKADYAKARGELEQQRENLDRRRSLSFEYSDQLNTPEFASEFPGMSAPQGAPGGMGMGGMGGGMGMGQMAGGAPIQPGGEAAEVQMNSIAGQIQILDLKAGKGSDAKDGDKPATAEEGVSVTYELDSAISLPSRSDRQLIQIASLPMEGEFTKVAVPVLTDHVYEQAKVTNSSDLVLLAGPTSSFVAGRFVGHGTLPTVTMAEEFTAGFGIDSSLRAHRELVDKIDTTQGGNRIVDFTYRLSIENFGAEPAQVRLMDRMPVGKEEDGEIAVTLVSPGQDLSDDPTYEQTERKQGILRWQVEAPAEAIGPEAFQMDYQFKMEYDRQMSIGGLASAE